MRCVRMMLVLIAVLCAAGGLAPGRALAETLDGVYHGLDEARGMSVRVSREANGYSGRFGAPGAQPQPFRGATTEQGFKAELAIGGRPGLAHFSAKPLGLAMVWAPYGTGGRADPRGAKAFVFRREEVALPRPPAGYASPPRPGARRASPLDFLNSYEFWEPAAAGRAYDLLEERHRALIRLFPAVHADVLWKLCQAPEPPFELGEALRGEGVACDEIDARLKQAQRGPGFARFKQRVHREKRNALRATECSLGINTPSVCAAAARRTQNAAASLETAYSILKGL